MKIILGADPLMQRPLTGIGNYTLHLARNLRELDLVSDLKLASHLGFVRPEEVLAGEMSENDDSGGQGSTHPKALPVRTSYATLTKWLSSSRLAVSAYQRLHGRIQRRLLAPFQSSHLYHSPNYLLPEFSGSRVVTIHDLSVIRFPEFHPAARVKLVEKMISKTVLSDAHIVCDSKLVASEISNHYSVDKLRLSVVPLGVDDCFQFRSSNSLIDLSDLGLQGQDFFLVVGTVEPRKNIKRICLAYRRFRQKNRCTMPLIFVGDRGWESSSEHAEIRDLESRGWARYLNYVPNDQLIVLYQNAAALIFTSLYEGFGLPAAEAKACGCRVIASEGSAMSEFLSEDDIQVNPYAVEDIARAMQHILDSRAVCRAAHIRAKGPRRWREVALDMSRVYSGLGA